MFTHNRQLEPVDPRGGTAAIMSNRTVRAGVSAADIEFPELGYAREAQTSYRWFAEARADGRVAAGTRFQVSLPTPYGILFASIDPPAVPVVEPAYEAAMLREIATICAAIPHEDLAIQWDVCIEMILFDGRVMPTPWDDDSHRARFRRLTAAVPADVHLGVHLCYGDYDGRHMIEPQDATKLTELANLVTEEAARPLQFIHMPVPIERDDDAYFAPFAGLELGPDTEVFLGLVHHADGVEGAQRRAGAAERYVPAFGVATECGIGRAHTTEEIETLFDIHAALTTSP
jgi:methionine synthase II (cobalamin-independent)